MGRIALAARLATRDFGHDWRIVLCQVLGLTAVLAPLLVLFGMRFGLIDTLAQRLIEDPRNREIVPAGSGRFDAAFFRDLAGQDGIAFIVPATRSIAASFTRLRKEDGGRPLSGVALLPSGPGDPLLAGNAPPAGDAVVLGRRLADSLGTAAGDRLTAEITRQRDGRIEAQRLTLTVSGITDAPIAPSDALLAPLDLLTATEDWRDGLGVGSRGWAGAPPPATDRVFARFRLYARSIYDVAAIEASLKERGVEVRTASADIAQMQLLDRNLGIAFWLIAGCGALGYLVSLAASLRAHVERKRRDLAMLRLIGLPTRSLVAFPVVQAVLIAVLGVALAGIVFQGAATALNAIFAGSLQPGERICRLLLAHFGIATAATILAALLSASWGGLLAARIQPSEGLRDV
ncbi:ABC transporter permease [Inquilinus sp. Marseille-Q2685]|uniref:ABC transporter permease n=1 Tax=Inquilinus sp. Marseille-Q2685 TaxID=2866581 RepID=UPI001CE476D5|nr:FtsX-like permease family protein [Inquilinus sp. Marseille-Q2685]